MISMPTSKINRLALYVYWDGQGEAKSYALHYIQALVQVCSQVLVIVNGNLSFEGQAAFQKVGAEVLLRENKGYDFAGWKAGFEHLGWDQVRSFDEVVLCNSSCYGPIRHSFEPVFQEMATRKADFWGLTSYPKEGRQIPWHIQSYFMVFKKNVVSSSEFKAIWDQLPQFKSWNDAVLKGEVRLTQQLQKAQFSCDTYIDCRQFEGRFHNPTILYPVTLLEQGMPLIKKKVFTEDYDTFYQTGIGDIALKTLGYLKQTDFPIQDIYDDVLKTLPPSAIRKVLHLNYALDEYQVFGSRSSKKVALIYFAYFEDLVDVSLQYIQNMPEDAQIYIVSSKQSVLDQYQQKIAQNKFEVLEFRLQENRGRNEAAYFTTCSDVWKKADYICLAHDKKTANVTPGVKGENYMEHCMRNLLGSRSFIQNVLHTFDVHPMIGMLEPPPPLFSAWEDTLSNLWGRNEAIAREFLTRTKGTYIWDKQPIAPFGGMMWVRSEALKSLTDLNLKVEDYPKEPLPVDGSLLHALERLYPTFVQQAGFYTGWLLTESYSRIYLDNLYHQLGCIYGSYGFKRNLKSFVKRRLKNHPKLYEIARRIGRQLN